eukprot:822436-Amphidinium_carterae.1
MRLVPKQCQKIVSKLLSKPNSIGPSATLSGWFAHRVHTQLPQFRVALEARTYYTGYTPLQLGKIS